MNEEFHSFLKQKAEELGLTLEQLEAALDAPFEFQAHVMKNLSDRKTTYFPSVRVPYWGIFYCPHWLRDKFKKKNESI